MANEKKNGRKQPFNKHKKKVLTLKIGDKKKKENIAIFIWSKCINHIR